MSQYALLIGLLLILFALAVLVAYLIARIKELSEQVKEYEKNIAVLNKQVEILEKERAQQDRIKEEYENQLEVWKQKNEELFEQLKEYEKNIAVLNEQMDKSAYERAQKLFEEWKEKELEVIKKDYENQFEKWKLEYEEKIREDAVKKSLSTILGKVGEEIKLNRRILGISEPPLTMLLLKDYPMERLRR